MKELAARSLTYEAVGATVADDWNVATAPRPSRPFERSVRLGDGDAVWARATDALMHWEVKTRSGFTIRAERESDDDGRASVALGRFWLIAHVGPLTIDEPAEVVAIVDEPDRKGYAYGTLEGHPVSGEEAFLVSRRADGSVWFTTRSLTRPSRGKWAFAFPGLLIGQRLYRRRYLHALTNL